MGTELGTESRVYLSWVMRDEQEFANQINGRRAFLLGVSTGDSDSNRNET